MRPRLTLLHLWLFGGVCVAIGAVCIVALFARVEREQHDIQQSRLAACQDANQRHSQTVRILGSLYQSNLSKATSKARRRELQQSQAAILLLVNALAPAVDCASLVASH